MDFDETLAASRSRAGDLGAAAYVVITAIAAGGATESTVEQVRAIVDTWLPRVDDETAAVLSKVLEARLDETEKRGAFDDAIMLASRMTTLEAHIAHDALAEQGVATRLRHDGPTAAEFPDPPSHVELWVRPADLARARRALKDLAAAADETVTCPQCAEDNPANFATCWNCHATL